MAASFLRVTMVRCASTHFLRENRNWLRKLQVVWYHFANESSVGLYNQAFVFILLKNKSQLPIVHIVLTMLSPRSPSIWRSSRKGQRHFLANQQCRFQSYDRCARDESIVPRKVGQKTVFIDGCIQSCFTQLQFFQLMGTSRTKLPFRVASCDVAMLLIYAIFEIFACQLSCKKWEAMMVNEMYSLMLIVVDDAVNHIFDNLPLIQVLNLNQRRPDETFSQLSPGNRIMIDSPFIPSVTPILITNTFSISSVSGVSPFFHHLPSLGCPNSSPRYIDKLDICSTCMQWGANQGIQNIPGQHLAPTQRIPKFIDAVPLTKQMWLEGLITFWKFHDVSKFARNHQKPSETYLQNENNISQKWALVLLVSPTWLGETFNHFKPTTCLQRVHQEGNMTNASWIQQKNKYCNSMSKPQCHLKRLIEDAPAIHSYAANDWTMVKFMD